MPAEIRNDKHGCSREVEDIEDGAVYVCGSKINTHINTVCKWTTQAVFLYKSPRRKGGGLVHR